MADDLVVVCRSCSLGNKMFGWALAMVAAERLEAFAQRHLDSIAGLVTSETRATFTKAVLDEATRLDVSSALVDRRIISLQYKGLELSCTTHGLSEEVGLRWGCFLRTHGRGVPPLPFEAEAFGKVERLLELDAPVLDGIRVARETLLQVLKDHPGLSYSEVCSRRGSVLTQCDQGSRVDVAIGQALLAKGGEDMLIDRLLNALPSASSTKTLNQSKQLIEQLREQGLFAVVNRMAQSVLEATLESIANMMGGHPPVREAFQQKRLPEIWARFEFFFAFVDVDGNTVYGKEAIDQDLAQAAETRKGLQLKDIERFHVFVVAVTRTAQHRAAEDQGCVGRLGSCEASTEGGN